MASSERWLEGYRIHQNAEPLALLSESSQGSCIAIMSQSSGSPEFRMCSCASLDL